MVRIKRNMMGKAFTGVMEHISSCMAPVIPGLIAGGLIKLLILLLGYAGILTEGSTTKQILMIISDAPFYFLPVLVAYSSALHFEVEPVYSIIVVCSMLLPDFITLMKSGAAVTFAGISVYKTSYAYTVLPIIFIVYVMSYVQKKLKRFLPKQISGLFMPMISILITAILSMLLIGPSIAFASKYLLQLVTYLQKHFPLLAWVLFDATVPLQIITGMHWVFVTLLLMQLGENGIEYGFMAGFFALSMSLSAISLAIRLKTKDKNLQRTALGMFITSFFTGTSEPALYGICMPYRKAMAICMISGAVVGVYQGIVGIHCYVYSFPAIFSVLMFQSSAEPWNLTKALIAGAISISISFIGTYLTFTDKAENIDKNEPDVNI